jgi:ribosomal protein L7Ae-like RNA K-turn-binding protein
MKKKKIESYLGLARRAGKIVSGYQTCLHTISRGSIRLIIAASDISEKTRDRFEGLCSRYGADFEVYGTVDELSEMTGFTGRGIYGITDRNFAEVMIKEIQNEKLIPEE